MVKKIEIKNLIDNIKTETWKSTELFCLNCGNKTVWEEQSEGDFYLGVQYLCISCNTSFYLPEVEINSKDSMDLQRLNKIKNT